MTEKLERISNTDTKNQAIRKIKQIKVQTRGYNQDQNTALPYPANPTIL